MPLRCEIPRSVHPTEFMHHGRGMATKGSRSRTSARGDKFRWLASAVSIARLMEDAGLLWCMAVRWRCSFPVNSPIGRRTNITIRTHVPYKTPSHRPWFNRNRRHPPKHSSQLLLIYSQCAEFASKSKLVCSNGWVAHLNTRVRNIYTASVYFLCLSSLAHPY